MADGWAVGDQSPIKEMPNDNNYQSPIVNYQLKMLPLPAKYD
jgi:hypothetical protein